MRLELIPVILGVLVGLVGLVLVADAVLPDGTFVPTERRRAPRPGRSLLGEAVLGVGVMLIAAALIGRDGWRYGTLAVLLAFLLCAVGLVLNWRYVRGLLVGVPASAGPAGTDEER
jgi:hypothetical protein